MFIKLSKAYQILIDPKKKAEYDNVYKARIEKKKRLEQMDSKRRKLKEGSALIAFLKQFDLFFISFLFLFHFLFFVFFKKHQFFFFPEIDLEAREQSLRSSKTKSQTEADFEKEVCFFSLLSPSTLFFHFSIHFSFSFFFFFE